MSSLALINSFIQPLKAEERWVTIRKFHLNSIHIRRYLRNSYSWTSSCQNFLATPTYNISPLPLELAGPNLTSTISVQMKLNLVQAESYLSATLKQCEWCDLDHCQDQDFHHQLQSCNWQTLMNISRKEDCEWTFKLWMTLSSTFWNFWVFDKDWNSE